MDFALVLLLALLAGFSFWVARNVAQAESVRDAVVSAEQAARLDYTRDCSAVASSSSTCRRMTWSHAFGGGEGILQKEDMLIDRMSHESM